MRHPRSSLLQMHSHLRQLEPAEAQSSTVPVPPPSTVVFVTDNLSHRIDHISGAEHDGDDHPGCSEAEKKFRQLDADVDSHLTVEEARPVIQSLISGEFSYAKSHAKLLMKADDNNDSKLSLEEMLKHYVSFYDTVYMDDHYENHDIGNVNDSHDELR
ncbi:hypothetical protein ABZP36_004216 [Zizania latifolia]